MPAFCCSNKQKELFATAVLDFQWESHSEGRATVRGHNRQAFTFCAFAFCESNQCKILFGSALEADHEKYELELILSLGVLAGADIKVAIALCIRFEQVLLGRSVSTLLVAP